MFSKRLFLIFLFTILTVFSNGVFAKNSAGLPAFSDSLVSALIVKNRIPGGICTVVQNGKVIYSAGFGLSDIRTKQKTDVNHTSYRVASITKLFTTVLILKLAEAGKLSLDDNLVPQLIALGVKINYKQPVTFRQLLTHTSGIDNSDINDAARDSAKVIPARDFCRVNSVVQVHEPGTTWHYSNAGMTIAGALAEKATGIAYEALVRQYILQPLGMQQTHFKYSDKNWATGYEEEENIFLPVAYEYPNTYPGGGITSTAPDMAKFMNALLTFGFLSRSSQTELFQSQFSYNKRDSQALGFEMSLYGNKLSAAGSTRIYSKNGSRPGFASLMYLVPEMNAGIFISVNARENSSCTYIASRIINKFYKGIPDTNVHAARPKLNLSEYNGTYVLVNSASGTIEKFTYFLKTSRYKAIKAIGNDSLSLDRKYVAYPVSKDFFRLSRSSRMMTFIRDKEGKIAYATLDLNKFRKISWFENINLNRRLFLFFNAFFLVFAIYLVVQVFKKRRKESSRVAILLTCVTGFLIPVYLVIEVSNAPEQLFDYGVPFFIKILPVLVTLLIPEAIICLFFLARDIKARKLTKIDKILDVTFMVITLFAIVWYNHFNLLWFRW